MATQTTNLSLRMPDPSDFVDVTQDISDNMSVIDDMLDAVGTSNSAPGDVASNGTDSAHASRADHVHGRTDGYGTVGSVSAVKFNTAAAAGSSANLARVDHVHTGPVEGDAAVATSEASSTNTYVDLATVGPTVTQTTGTKVLVIITVDAVNATALNISEVGVDVSGATTTAAADTFAAKSVNQSTANKQTISATFPLTVTAGSNTFKLKYKSPSGTSATYANRFLQVINLN